MGKRLGGQTSEDKKVGGAPRHSRGGNDNVCRGPDMTQTSMSRCVGASSRYLCFAEEAADLVLDQRPSQNAAGAWSCVWVLLQQLRHEVSNA